MDRAEISARLREAWDTLRRVPAHGIPGYRTAWPEVLRDVWEAYSLEGARIRLEPASPRAIDRMHEVFGWFVYLEGKRHLAQAMWLTCGCGMGPHRAGVILGVHRNTVRQRRDDAIDLIIRGLSKSHVANVRNVRECAA